MIKLRDLLKILDINAFKNQQHRWAKGSIQVAIKLMKRVLSSQFSAHVKREAWYHLTGNIAYLMMAIFVTILPYTLILRKNRLFEVPTGLDVIILFCATGSILLFYGASQYEVQPKSWIQKLWLLPVVLMVGIGLVFNNTKAVIEALLRMESSFVRTPKWAIDVNDDQRESVELRRSTYKSSKGMLPLIELIFAGYYLFGLWICITGELYFSFPFVLLFFSGFLYVGFLSSGINWPRKSIKERISKVDQVLEG